ncbi:translation repressor RelB, partial [Vibrio vulnificus]
TDALKQYLDEHEDFFLAKDALEEFTQSNDEIVLHEEVDWDSLGE